MGRKQKEKLSFIIQCGYDQDTDNGKLVKIWINRNLSKLGNSNRNENPCKWRENVICRGFCYYIRKLVVSIIYFVYNK